MKKNQSKTSKNMSSQLLGSPKHRPYGSTSQFEWSSESQYNKSSISFHTKSAHTQSKVDVQFHHYLEEQIKQQEQKLGIQDSVNHNDSKAEIEDLKWQIQQLQYNLNGAQEQNNILLLELQNTKTVNSRSEEQLIQVMEENLTLKATLQDLNRWKQDVLTKQIQLKEENAQARYQLDQAQQRVHERSLEVQSLQKDINRETMIRKQACRSPTPERLKNLTTEMDIMRSQLGFHQKNRYDESRQQQKSMKELQERLETQEQINEWLKQQLKKITNGEDWMVYKQLLTHAPASHNYIFKNPKKKDLYRRLLQDQSILLAQLEIAEVNEQNLEKAVGTQLSEYHIREKEYLARIKQLEASARYCQINYRFSSTLRCENDASDERLKFQTQNAELRKRIDDQQTQIANLMQVQQNNIHLQDQLQKAAQKYRISQDEICRLQQQLGSKIALMREIEASFQQYKNKQGKVVSENTHLKQSNDNLFKLNDKLTQIQEQIDAEMKQKDKLIEELQRKIQDIRARTIAAESKMKELMQREADLQVEVSTLTEANQHLTNQMGRVTDSLKSRDLELKAKRTVISQLREEIKILRRGQENEDVLQEGDIDEKIYNLETRVRDVEGKIQETTQREEMITGDVVPQDLHIQLDEETILNRQLCLDGFVMEDEIDEALILKLSQLQVQILQVVAHVQ